MANEQNKFSCESISFEQYSQLISQTKHSLYFAPWWLKTIKQHTTDGELIFYAVNLKNEAVAVFVALYKYQQIITADYCQHLGIHYLNEELSPYKQQQVCLVLHQSLPKHHYFNLNLSPNERDWLPWHWAGYSQTTRYNFVLPIDHIHSEEDFIATINRRLRRNLKASIKAGFSYVNKVDVDEALEIFLYNSDYKGYKTKPELLRALIKEGLKTNNADLVGVKNKDGQLAMVSFFVRCDDRTYFIAEGCYRNLCGKHQLKNVLLMNYILQREANITMMDFEGSMIESIAKIYQAMGAIQESYFTIIKGRRYTPYYIAHKLLSKVNKRFK